MCYILSKNTQEKTEMMYSILPGAEGSGNLATWRGLIEELSNNNYHSHQQIADMIQEKYGIKVSLPAIGRLLKKWNQAIEMWLVTRQSRPRETTRILRQRAQAFDGQGKIRESYPFVCGRRSFRDGL